MTDLRAFCYQCHHAWTAHDDGTDDGDYCRVCECDGYMPGAAIARPPNDRGCRWCQALPGEWCEDDCGSPSAEIHPVYRASPTVDLWSKRNTPSGHFEAIKRGGDVLKGAKREN